MSNSEITPPSNEWKPLTPVPEEESVVEAELDTEMATEEAELDVEMAAEESELDVEMAAEEAELDVEMAAEEAELDVEDDESELEDLPTFERMIIDAETGAVSGKPVENKHRKGTLPWIKTEHEASAKLLDEIEQEFERNRNVLKIAIAMSRSARILKDEKLEELSKFQDTRDSLAAWIAERQGTYAWTLLAALGKERDKLEEFEKSVRAWTETTTTEIVEQSRKNKKKFIRRIGFGFAGILAALGVGALVNLFLGWLGITWIITLLAFIGFTNPFVWVPNFLIGGSIATWLVSLFSYFQSYLKWRKMVDRHVAEARYYVSAVKQLQGEKGRIVSLHAQMEDYLKLLSEILHKPWEISDEWINWSTPQLETASLPTSLVVAKPLESGEYEAVRKHSLEAFASTDWHSEQVRVLFAEYEKAQKMNKGAVEERIDKDVRLRVRLLEDLEQSNLLTKVGDEFVQNLAKKLQSEDLPAATQFHVASLKPDVLEKLDLSDSMFNDGETRKNWTAFVAEILGKATAWSPLAYSTSGLFDRLEKRSEVNSFALIPDRIKNVVDPSVRQVIMDNTTGSGVEVVVRVDISSWLEPKKIAILDDSTPQTASQNSAVTSQFSAPTPITSPDPTQAGHVTF